MELTIKKNTGGNIRRYLVYLAVFLLPFEQIYELLWDFSSLFKPYRVVFMLLAFNNFLISVFTKTLKTDRFLLVSFFVILYGISLAGVRAFFEDSMSLYYTQEDARVIFFSLLVFYVLSKSMHSEAEVIKLFYCFTGGLFISILWSYFFLATSFSRFSSFYANPNAFAFSCALVINFLLWRVSQSSNIRTIIFLFCLVVWFLFFAFLSLSRGGVIVLGLVFIFHVSLYLRKRKKLSVFFCSLVVLVFFILVYQQADFLSRLSVNHVMRDGGTGRKYIWQAAWRVFQDYPLLGIGFGQFRSFCVAYMPSEAAGSSIQGFSLGVHNQYLAILVEFGVVFFFAYILFLAHFIKKLRVFSVHQENNYGAFILIGLYSFLFMDMTQLSYTSPSAWLAISIALISAFKRETYISPHHRASISEMDVMKKCDVIQR